MNKRRVANVMQKHMLHSEHAALCYIEAERRERVKERAMRKAVKQMYDEADKLSTDIKL